MLTWIQYADFVDGLAQVQVGGKVGFVDTTGNLVIPASFDEAHDFSEGFASVKLKGKFGFIDKTGKVLVPPQFKYSDDFKNGLAGVTTPEKRSGFVNSCGSIIWEDEL